MGVGGIRSLQQDPGCRLPCLPYHVYPRSPVAFPGSPATRAVRGLHRTTRERACPWTSTKSCSGGSSSSPWSDWPRRYWTGPTEYCRLLGGSPTNPPRRPRSGRLGRGNVQGRAMDCTLSLGSPGGLHSGHHWWVGLVSPVSRPSEQFWPKSRRG